MKGRARILERVTKNLIFTSNYLRIFLAANFRKMVFLKDIRTILAKKFRKYLRNVAMDAPS